MSRGRLTAESLVLAIPLVIIWEMCCCTELWLPWMYVFLLGTTRRRGFSLAVAVLYLILGLHTEPVAWIMGRKDILSTLFMLLALCAQTRRLTTARSAARCGWYLLTLAAFAGGLLSKVSVLTFPLVLFLHAVLLPYLRGERLVSAPFDRGRSLVRELALFLPAMALDVWILPGMTGNSARRVFTAMFTPRTAWRISGIC